MKKRKILFVAAHRKDRAPNQRFRFEQYFDFLNANGFECVLAPLIPTAEEDNAFYGESKTKKISAGVKMFFRRMRDLSRGSEYDLIFIAREAFFLGSTFFERQFKKNNARIIFDFDDSIWLDVISDNNKLFSWLKNGSKTADIIKLADRVFAGNQFLANYALQFNSNVTIIPTTIDTGHYLPQYSVSKQKVTIGWSGSVSTIEHFKTILPVLERIRKKYGDKVQFSVVGDKSYKNEVLDIVGKGWSRQTELRDLHEFDIGIMPLPDTEWAWGKCGLKGLQYMALEIPTIMAPVGVNRDIINDGENGFLANKDDEWVSKLSLLIEDPELRLKLGRNGRETVVRNYSVAAVQDTYLNEFKTLLR